MTCKIDHDDKNNLTIPRFLCGICTPRTTAASRPRLATRWVDPVEARQRELRAAQAATIKAKRAAALAKYLRKIEDEHAGEEWDRKSKMWIRTKRSMAKHEARLLAEFEASAVPAADAHEAA